MREESPERDHRRSKRRSILFLAVIVILLALSPPALRAAAVEDKSPTRPNILFILTDDQRWDVLGCYGNDVIKTPNFDRLATEGARLDAFYVASPLCCPSRAAFLSGLYPHQSGVLTNIGMPDLKPNTPTVATYLNKAGYITGFIGKAHLGGDPRRWDFKECPLWLDRVSSPQPLMFNGESRQFTGDETDLTRTFTDAALEFVEKHKQDRWFLWFATTAPHTPYVWNINHHYRKKDMKPPPGWPPGQPFERWGRWAQFYSTIGMLDDQVGRVLQKLDELGLAKNTLVVMASDNGLMFGSHGIRAKQVWFDESARVPALVRWPGKIKPGIKVAAPLVSVDFLPTVLQAAGVRGEMPKILEGKSMIPALTTAKPLRKVAYSEVNEAGRSAGGGYWHMARDQRWKYVRFEGGEEHLYDLKADPLELTDLGTSTQRGDVMREMRGKLTAWLKSTPEQTTANSVPGRATIRSTAQMCCDR
jgi:arylsulfatase A-like enzyme